MKKSLFHFGDAYDFYKKFIFNKEKQELLKGHGLHVAGSVPSVDWELFGSILTGDLGKKGYGSDLKEHEIKSAIDGASFEYQYHLHGGQQKLKEDMGVKHLFISYSPDYKNLDVRILPGEQLTERFSSWLPKLIENYSGPNHKQRYRKNVPFGFVKENGTLVMRIREGKVVKQEDVKSTSPDSSLPATQPLARKLRLRSRKALD